LRDADGKIENNEMDKRNAHRISVRKRSENRPIRNPKGKCGTEKNFK
jgi:hypothetical protein